MATLSITPRRIRGARLNNDVPRSGLNILFLVVAIGLSILFLLPFMWVVTTALKGNSDIYKIPPEFFPRELHFENFEKGINAINFGRLFLNSTLITVFCTIGSVSSSMLVGFGLSRIRFPGRKIWFYLFVGSMMVPGIVGLIPMFKLFVSLKWLDTWLPIIVPAFFGNPLYIFLARQFYMSIPFELDEAAKMDGASYWTIFTKVMIPLTRPLWITMMIFSFQGAWNEYLTPLIYIYSEGKWTLSMGMAAFSGAFAGVSATQWNQYMATNLLYMLPPLIIFFIAQRHFMEGLGSLGATTQK